MGFFETLSSPFTFHLKFIHVEVFWAVLQGDVDKDGHLDYGEFVAISVHLRKMGSDDDHLHKAFDFFDLNQSGYIEIEELRDSLADEIENNNEEVINAIMQDVDTDKVRISSIVASVVFSHFSSGDVRVCVQVSGSYFLIYILLLFSWLKRSSKGKMNHFMHNMRALCIVIR